MPKASPLIIVLASQSPRRRELAEAEGWQIEVCPPPETAEDEATPRQPSESLEAWVARLAKTKAEAVVTRFHPAPSGMPRIVLACDTVGVVDDTPLGKPIDRDDAARMLRQLSGRLHRVLTGSCLWPPGHQPTLAVTESVLIMPPLSDEFIATYLDSGLWRGKAGACGFQDGVIPLGLQSGSGSNVIGLPLETIRNELAWLTSSTTASSPSSKRLDAHDGLSFHWYPAETC